MIYKYYDFFGSCRSRSLLPIFVHSRHWLEREKIASRVCKVLSHIQSFVLGGDERTKHNYPLYPQCYIAWIAVCYLHVTLGQLFLHSPPKKSIVLVEGGFTLLGLAKLIVISMLKNWMKNWKYPLALMGVCTCLTICSAPHQHQWKL